MASAPEFAVLAERLSADLELRLQPQPERSVTGGSINSCYCWQSPRGPIFVKTAPASMSAAFDAEAAGLEELAAAAAVRVPGVLANGCTAATAYLALEWIEGAATDGRVEAILGERLAAQHRVQSRHFGWHRDNTLGSTPQENAWSADWLSFFRDRRLRPQFKLAANKGFSGLAERGTRLLAALPLILADHRPEPSLLHGDLWGGNWMAAAAHQPVIFDPAVYYGDREADIAQTYLFGGFGRSFYAAYEQAWPLSAGHEARRELYNLYHVVNHANLFGADYAARADAMIERLLLAAGSGSALSRKEDCRR